MTTAALKIKTKKKKTRKRPIIISMFCVVGFIVSAFQIILISYPGIRGIAKWYPIVYGFLTAFRFMATVGVWHMKKWGAELFTYVTLFKILVLVLVDDFTMLAKLDAFVSVIFSVIFMLFYKRMSRNL
ncbi:MAG TPA: hypothetical protein VL651_11755 [Bacteroidia bacterium]|nr:hypothetical protein [Bacteroidia bacterium]